MKFTAEFIEQRMVQHKAWQQAETNRLVQEALAEARQSMYPNVPAHSFSTPAGGRLQ
jgi:hypothetical protein